MPRSFLSCRAIRSDSIQRRTTMPVIKVTDMAYGKLRSPDLDAQEEFLTHFGMVRADRTKHALYMRGTDPAHHLHVTEQGDPGLSGSRITPQAKRICTRWRGCPGPRVSRTSTSPAGASAFASRNPTAIRSRWCGASSSFP